MADFNYTDKVMDHFMNPRNVGEIPDASGIGNVGNPVCVLPDTLIYTNPNIAEIEKLVKDTKVLCHDGRYHRVASVISRKYKGIIYSLQINNLGTVCTTPEHHILSLKLGKYGKFCSYKKYIPDWYCAEELRKGDFILYPIPKETEDTEEIGFDIEKPKWDFKSKALPQEIKIDDDFCRLIGYYLAEGYTRIDPCKGTLGFVFGAKEKEYIEDVIFLVKNVFGIAPAKLESHPNATGIIFYSARLARFFSRHFGKGAEDKHLPSWTFFLPLQKQRELLTGLFRGDGSIDIKRQRAKYVTISRQLAYQLRLLLLRRKIISNFSIGKAYGIHKKNYVYYIQDDDSLKKIIEIMGLNFKINPRRLNIHKSWFDENFYYTSIRKITPIDYRGLVHNLEVEDSHSFVSNALVLHNCGDVMRMYIKVENDIIVDAKFKTFGCLPANEKIVLSKGGWEEISDVHKETMVINSEGKKTRVVETYVRNYKGKLLKIVPLVSPFNSFSVTPEHPIYCVKREWINGARRSGSKCDRLRIKEENLFFAEPEFIKAKELSEGDYLIFNVNQEIKDSDLFTEEIMRLMGYYLSEGYVSAQGGVVVFAFNKKEKKLINEMAIILENVTGKKPKQRVRGDVKEIYICSRRLARFLLLHCKKIARSKSLSKDVLLLPFSKQWGMIETYLSGDGDNYRRRPHNSKTYRIITTSPSLAIQMQEMLARGGIFASIRQILKTNCFIGKRKLKDSIQYLISFKRVRNHKFVHYNGKYFFVPIKKINVKNFRGHIYNFQVCDEPNSYLVRGFAVHNCGAAIATSSMVTELIKGKTVEEALKISNRAVAEALGGLPPIKIHCSVLAEQALRAALADYYRKIGKDPSAFEPKQEDHPH